MSGRKNRIKRKGKGKRRRQGDSKRNENNIGNCFPEIELLLQYVAKGTAVVDKKIKHFIQNIL